MPPTASDTPQAILHAAYDLFLQKGYHGTSMRAIAAQAGIALGGIYNHYSSKEDIFRSVLLAFHPYTEILPALADADVRSVEELVVSAGRMIDRALRNQPHLINLMFIEIVEFRSKHIPDLLAVILPEISRILTRFSEAGDGLRPIPIPMLMRTFMGLILGYVLTENALGVTAPPEFRHNALEYFLDIYLHGVVQPEVPA